MVDGKGMPLGRLAAYVAKLLLEGKQVVVVNAAEAVISGNAEDIFARWKQRIDLSSLGNPEKYAPKYSRTIEGIVRRAVRGMLPWRTKRGRDAFRRLKVFRDFPEEFKHLNVVRPDFKTPRKHITVAQLSAMLGGKV